MLTNLNRYDIFFLRSKDESWTNNTKIGGKKMNIFQMKAKPHGHEKLNDFFNEGYVCIGWPGISDLTDVSKDEIRERLKKKYNYEGHTLGYNLGQVHAFVNTMQMNDVVLIKDNEIVHIGIVGAYQYEKQFDNDIDGLCHRRSVEWKESIALSDLNKEVQRFVNNRHTISQYPGTIESNDFKELYNKKATLTKDEKDRFYNLFSEALDVLEEELKSEDPERRLKAASELIRLKSMGGMGDE